MREGTHERRLFRASGVVLLALAMAIGSSLSVVDLANVSQALLVVGGLMAVLVLISRGPLWCLAAVIFLAVLGWSPTILSVGAVDLKPVDVFYVALLISVGVETLRRSEAGDSLETNRAEIGQRAIWVFILLLGVGILGIYRRDPDSAGGSLVSWIRLVQTMTLISLVPVALKTRGHLSSILRVLALAAVASVVLAISGLTGAGAVLTGAERAGTLSSPNVVGLLSGVLLVLVLHSSVPSARWARTGVAVAAVIGLIGSKSIGSLLATALVLTLGGFHSKRPALRVREHTLLPLVLRTLVVVLVVVDLTLVLRPQSLPGQLEFSSSSTMHRVLVGNAGLEIFKRHPVSGVGWQQSSTPEFIGDPEVNRALHRRFPDASPGLFPDVSATSVHNFYIQTLAEAGIIGFVVLMWALLVILGRMRSLVRGLEDDQWAYQQARFLALALLLTVVWLNENPLFGGHTPATLLALFLGLAGALARITARTTSPSLDRSALA